MMAARQALMIAAALFCFGLMVPAQAGEFDPRPSIADNPDLVPGTVINQANVDSYRDVLAPAIADMIASGLTQIDVGPFLQLPLQEGYVAATENNPSTVSLGAEVGNLRGYINGRPFPGPRSTEEDRAGEKVAWNMRYSYGPDETETKLMTWRYKDLERGEERRIEMYGALMRFAGRHTREPMPALENNPQGLFAALYLKVDFPFDIRNTQLLTHTKLDDGAPEDAWIYLNTQRRVKRLGTGQKTDAFLGSDIMIEDFLGYNGRIRDMHWEFIGSTEILAPIYGFDDLSADRKITESKHTLIDFTGSGQCFPNITWQPRSVYIVKATPVAEDHPIGHRVFYVDAATYAPVMTQIYDRADKLWKLGLVAFSDSSKHGPENVEWYGTVTDAVSMIDIQARHCTTLQFKIQIPEKDLRPKLFTTQQMRSAGR